MRLDWKRLYVQTDKFSRSQGYIAICIICAVSTIGLLYIQEQINFPTQYLATYAAALYFVGRLAFALRYRLTIGRDEGILLSLIILMIVSLTMQSVMGLDFIDQNGVSSHDYTLSMWAFAMFYLFAGASCNRAKHSKSLVVALVLMGLALIPIVKAADGGLLLMYWQIGINLGIEGFSHLNIAEWVVFLLIGAYAFAKPLLRPVIVVLALYCLFALQGRSSTFFTIVTFIVFGLLTQGKKSLYTWVGIAVVAAAAYAFLPIEQLFYEADEKSIERMLLSQDEEDGSLAGRSEVLGLSLGLLPKAAAFGDPTILAREMQQMGSYIHNILSMWQFFGLIPFLLLVYVIFISLIKMYKTIASKQYSVMDEMAALLLIYSTISVIAAKSIVFYWIWFSIGYWMLSYSYETHGKKKSKGKRRRRSRSSSSRTSREYKPA